MAEYICMEMDTGKFRNVQDSGRWKNSYFLLQMGNRLPPYINMIVAAIKADNSNIGTTKQVQLFFTNTYDSLTIWPSVLDPKLRYLRIGGLIRIQAFHIVSDTDLSYFYENLV